MRLVHRKQMPKVEVVISAADGFAVPFSGMSSSTPQGSLGSRHEQRLSISWMRHMVGYVRWRWADIIELRRCHELPGWTFLNIRPDGPALYIKS
jgi:hypothetical protein